MAQSNFEKTLGQVTKGDGTLNRLLADQSTSSFNNGSMCDSKNCSGAKTPGQRSRCKPGDADADRFIPSRVGTDLELGGFLLQQDRHRDPETETEQDRKYQQAIAESMSNDPGRSGNQILHYNHAARRERNALVVNTEAPPTCEKKRLIPSAAEKVLDAPNLMDDYYLNNLDWSSGGLLALALTESIYLWNSVTGDITELMQCGETDEYVCSLRWLPLTDNILAVGSSLGRVQLWDVTTKKLMRTMLSTPNEEPSRARVPALAWNEHLLSTGSHYGWIRHNDVRVERHEISSIAAHRQEVCGLEWSSNGTHLASGGNDNLVNILQMHSPEPLYSLDSHKAAVKAVSWCPWKPMLLATGGGLADGYMRFWSANTGAAIKAVNTGSAVCGIIWNSEYKELITGHGATENQLTIWKYPQVSKITDLIGHTGRVLCLASSPSGEVIASSAADETLRIWSCFTKSKSRDKAKGKSTIVQPSVLRAGIR